MSDTTATESAADEARDDRDGDRDEAGVVDQVVAPSENGAVTNTQPGAGDEQAEGVAEELAEVDSGVEVDSVVDSDDIGDGDAEGETEAAASNGTASAAGGRGKVPLRRLEEEGEVAADYLEELLDIVDLDGDIDIDVENGRASVAIVAEDGSERELRRLVGSRGEVLEALQELSRLAVQARTGERSRLMLDIAGFRAARKRKLEDIAARACQEVKRTGEAVKLDPMSAFERKVVHDVVAEAGLVSESEGEDPGRRVVIHPAGA